ncbi:MalY/PatB family protein [Pseudomonas huanghezhanensis]|uniref:MalY/PatB family protein n=1 Tax=Pseudomonas huanghezhanensis TaxID=3002903 RepID=UPI00228688DC|nr:PatB family C-S lyase [Pseudomonas sp. BSw22131]
MTINFNTAIERRATGSKKWSQYADDVLPMWVADMDFPVAPAILAALQARLEHPLLGYAVVQDSLRETLVKHLWSAYAWRIQSEDLVFLPGVEPGVNMALHALVPSGAGVAVQTPNYSPLLQAPSHWRLPRIDLPLRADAHGEYHTDIAALDEALKHAGALLLSNPHNPLGKVFHDEELQLIADACVRHDVLLISDEIHADILFDGRRHIPIASISPQIASRSVTLMSASKAWNIAGLKTAFAVIQNPELRQRFNAGRLGMVDSVNALGLDATQAAYSEGADWLRQMLAYLQGNRDYLAEAVRARLPGIKMHVPQSTYLAWLDCSGLGLDNPQQFFLENAKVALSAGHEFGEDCGQFVRLNFGCPRDMLEEGLSRLERSLADEAARLRHAD